MRYNISSSGMMRYILLIMLLGLLGDQHCHCTALLLLSSSSSLARGLLPQGTNYRTKYLARYQHFADNHCNGPNAIIEIYCRGDIAPISISHSTIQCNSMTDSNGWNGLVCINTCNNNDNNNNNSSDAPSSSCEDTYLERTKVEDGIYGELTYFCSGEILGHVDSYLVYVGGDDGRCEEEGEEEGEEEDNNSDKKESRNYHRAQLGIQCSSNTTSSFRFDEHHSECSTGTTAGRFACSTGANCQGQEQCRVDYDDVVVYAYSQNFLEDECIEVLSSNDGTSLSSSSSLKPTPQPTPQIPLPSEPVVYTVEYGARFQQVVSPGCINSNPAMVLTCLGEVLDVRTSHPSIECGVESIQLDDGRKAILCENTCAGEDCDSIFLSRYELGGTGPFGEVYFSCVGETPNETDGAVIILEGGPGSCDGTDVAGASYNFRIAQLAVRCPGVDGSLVYAVDDHHGDCGPTNRAINVNNQYSCFAGKACGNEPCLIEFDQLIVAADPHQFVACIQASNGSPIPKLAPPEIPVKDAGIYISTFQAIWEFVIDSSCIGSNSPKLITCTNGSIRLVDSLDSSCEVTSQSSIECTDDATKQGGVTYECQSTSAIPETHVEYASGEARCDVSTHVERQLQLGILCGDPGSYTFQDIFLECGPRNTFDIGLDGSTYTCLSTLSVSASARTAQRVAAVEIFTDYRWPLFASELCYKYTPVHSRQLSQRSSSPSMTWMAALGVSLATVIAIA